MRCKSVMIALLIALGGCGEWSESEEGPRGPQGEEGEAARCETNADCGEDGVCIEQTGLCRGPQGEDGEDGERGPQGERGPEGPQGPAGESCQVDRINVDCVEFTCSERSEEVCGLGDVCHLVFGAIDAQGCMPLVCGDVERKLCLVECLTDDDCHGNWTCSEEQWCMPPPPPQPELEECDDGIDNDHDGRTDCADADCQDEAVCQPPAPEPERCNGRDDDHDGETDEGELCGTGLVCEAGRCIAECDPDRDNVPNHCPPAPAPEQCDGVDNDGDGFIDEDADRICGSDLVCRGGRCVNDGEVLIEWCYPPASLDGNDRGVIAYGCTDGWCQNWDLSLDGNCAATTVDRDELTQPGVFVDAIERPAASLENLGFADWFAEARPPSVVRVNGWEVDTFYVDHVPNGPGSGWFVCLRDRSGFCEEVEAFSGQ